MAIANVLKPLYFQRLTYVEASSSTEDFSLTSFYLYTGAAK